MFPISRTGLVTIPRRTEDKVLEGLAIFQHRTRILLTVLAAFAVNGSVSAQQATNVEKVPRLIQQLIHPDFRQRIAAEKSLLELGESAIPELESSIKNAGGELRYRGERLLSAFQSKLYLSQFETLKVNPWKVGGATSLAWERLHELTGDSPASRALFIHMLRSDPELTLSVAVDQARCRMLLEARCIVVSELKRQSSSTHIPVGTTAAILFATLCTETVSPGTSRTVSELLNSQDCNDALQAEMEFLNRDVPEYSQQQTTTSHENHRPMDSSGRNLMTGPDGSASNPVRIGPLRSLISHWIRRPLVSSRARLDLAIRYRLPDGVVPAREILNSSRTQLSRPQQAVFFLALFGGPDAVTEIEPLLENQFELHGTTVSTESGPVKFTCQVRDVALLALVMCTGQAPVDYGFGDLRENPTQLYELDRIGFGSDADRAQALNRWKSWRARHRFEELKPWHDASEGILL